MYKIGKKGKNPTAVDFWLDTLGLYRKNVAYDETCLFRAISEQLFDCQIYHERVRRECLLFARENYTDFVDDESTSQFFHHLDKLEKHMVVCGEIELNIITKKYKKSITVFDATDQQIHHYSENEFDKAFLLCLMDRDHYDVVYKKEHIEAAGFCQSIVYKTLYENVFGIAKVDEIVHNMLYDKGNIITQAELMMEKKRLESENKELTFEELQEKFNLKNLALNIAPFPFKIAKALDPNIYRNIEYDSWGEMRREWRLGEWYHGDNKLILGTKCIYHDIRLNEKFDCYIQEMIKNENMCVIYLTKLAEKRTVKYTDLSPEDDAKPWPLPYRFSKSVIISPSTPPTDRILPKPKRRNRDKKRTKSETSLLSSSYAAKQDHPVDNIDAYIGIPLQIQYPHNDNITYCTDEMATELQLDQTTPISPNEIQENLTDDNSRWYQWQPYIQPQTDPFVWPTIPGQTQNVYNYNVKPMIASAPVTPSVIPYHDHNNYSYYYNYSYQTYPQWTSPLFELQPPPPPRNKTQEQTNNEVSQSPQQELPQETIQKNDIANNCDNNNFRTTETVNSNYVQQPETAVCYTQHCTTCTPIEPYSPMVQVPQMGQGTSILYTGAPPPPAQQEVTEVLLPTTPVLYTPPVEVPYVQSSPYVYPPTPPPSWPYTPQGFIFPPRT
ncbi:protein ovarian tumor locus-like isoform X3 [Diorhabda sublineata]|uniref:protein ovarian tumor locus-like isoform X3 n=1 Tax=Diorhabda sublineata TaxID=1163346 RepID=UPI0024E17A39|nr:protein ovarian tumor locus-like isoform X3 [Diorhabda sublineata]